MLKKTMKQVIEKKFKNWVASITDEDVKKAIRKNTVLAGGCFASMILNEPINDFDFYFRDKETVLKVCNYYANQWNIKHQNRVMVLDCDHPSDEILNYYCVKDINTSNSVMLNNFDVGRIKLIIPSKGFVEDEYLPEDIQDIISDADDIERASLEKGKDDFEPVFITTNAITLKGGIQLVVRFYGDPKNIHDTYDFEHTKAYWTSDTECVEIPAKVYEYATNKTLHYTGSKYPLCSIFRIRKFIERGWTINAGQILKIAMQISDLYLTNIKVLEDQLVGVDTVYFLRLIKKLSKEGTDITSDYVVTLIDKIF